MKIYTKTGDLGETSLIGGSRVSKADARIEAYGSVDELSAFVSALRDRDDIDTTSVARLDEILRNLLVVESHLALENDAETKKFIPSLEVEEVSKLEKYIDEMTQVLPELKCLIVSGGDRAASEAHVCRTVCRRAERRIVALSRQTDVDDIIIRYMNRLSDFFFTLARFFTFQHGKSEKLWK